MGEFSLTHIMLFLVIVLIFFGPSRLPSLGSSMGRAIRGFKDAMKSADDEPTAEARPSTETRTALDTRSAIETRPTAEATLRHSREIHVRESTHQPLEVPQSASFPLNQAKPTSTEAPQNRPEA